MKRELPWSMAGSLAAHAALLLLLVPFIPHAHPPPVREDVSVRFLLVQEDPPAAPDLLPPAPEPPIPPPPDASLPPPAAEPAPLRAPEPPAIHPVITTKPGARPAPANPERKRAGAPPPVAAGSPARGSAAGGGSGPTTSAHPRYALNPPPRYPPEALRARQHGTVLLRVKVAADGSVSDLSVKRTSGFPALDEAAIAAVRRWKFEPARVAGQPVAEEVEVPVRFQPSQ